MKNALIISLLILLLSTQCRRRDETDLDPIITNLVGTWRLTQPDSSYAVTLQIAYDTDNPPIDITPFKATGKSSVNDYTIRLYATVDGMMSADHLSSTKINGSVPAMQFEQTYLANLDAVVRYDMPAKNQLRLYYGGTNPSLLVYEKSN